LDLDVEPVLRDAANGSSAMSAGAMLEPETAAKRQRIAATLESIA
jgi:hypothetical protein